MTESTSFTPGISIMVYGSLRAFPLLFSFCFKPKVDTSTSPSPISPTPQRLATAILASVSELNFIYLIPYINDTTWYVSLSGLFHLA